MLISSCKNLLMSILTPAEIFKTTMHTAPWFSFTQKQKGDITMPNIVIAIAIILLAEAAFLGVALIYLVYSEIFDDFKTKQTFHHLAQIFVVLARNDTLSASLLVMTERFTTILLRTHVLLRRL